MKAILALEDGRYFEGESFGASATRTGEICFNTSMTGYQEVITDPSYRGQIVAMTYPMIGNTGINYLDEESDRPQIQGLAIEELCEVPSNWRSGESLGEYFKRFGVPGVQGIDTRALTNHLRELGSMRSVITSEVGSVKEAVELAQKSTPMEGSDFVKEVSTSEIQLWDPNGTNSPVWDIPNPARQLRATKDGVFHPLPDVKYRVVAYDFGIKRNILRRMRQEGFEVTLVPSRTSAEDVLALNPDGVFLSNGPGDPGALDYIHTEVKKLITKKPIFAICLGHQILGHAFGGKTYKMKFGHRGGNHPVKDLRTGKIVITSQNHGFAVDQDSLPSNVEVTHINLNDQSIEGLGHKDYPVLSVQYHPEAAPGPKDASYFFNDFANLIEASR